MFGLVGKTRITRLIQERNGKSRERRTLVQAQCRAVLYAKGLIGRLVQLQWHNIGFTGTLTSPPDSLACSQEKRVYELERKHPGLKPTPHLR